MEKRLQIAVITARIVAPEQKHILEGVLNKAQTLNVDTVILSNIYNFNEYSAHVEIENQIYDLITSPQMDGIILTAEAFLNPKLQDYIYERIKCKDIPVVIIGAEFPEMNCINNDIIADYEDITRHLTDVHHFTDIDILTGNKGIQSSYQRVQGCRNVLEQHGIALSDENIIFGDFWTNSVEALAMEYIQNKRRLPQAIICANDYMAFGLCDMFLKHGIRVPEDVTIIGYDYIGSRSFHVPVLSTYFRNRKAVGMNAMELLYNKITGHEPDYIPCTGSFISGDSCPCGINREQFYDELIQGIRVDSYLDISLDSMFEHELTVCRNIGEYIQVLRNFVSILRDVAGVYLCLYEDWYSMDANDITHTNDSIMLCYRIISSQNNCNEPILFKRSHLYPESIAKTNRPDILYFAPIFISGREFGYFIMQYDKPDGYDEAFKIWLKITSSGLETLRMKNDIRTLLECQNLSEFNDTTTGLLNRTGFTNEVQHALHTSEPEDTLILVLIRTALFSDNTSIDKKEIFVRMETQIAKCLKQSVKGEKDFCAKIGDGFFAVGCVGQYEEGYEALLSDKLNVLILHSPLYSEHQGTDTLLCTAARIPAKDSQIEEQAKLLYRQMQSQIEALSAIRNDVKFSEFHALRISMYREPNKNWDLDETCRLLHLSKGYFRMRYKKLFGISFHHDFLQSRISFAKYLLLTTNLSLNSIAVQCGYEEGKYFLRQFRQITGFTPNYYRNTF